MKKWKIYLINLARSTDRLTACARQLDVHDLPYERIDAIDGDDMHNSAVDDIYDFNKSSYHKHMTKGEIACYLSHVKTWQRIVDKKLDYAVILEDDILLQDGVQEALDAIASIDEPWDLIKLAEAPIKRKVEHHIPVADFSLVTYNKVPIRCCAQVISLAGAKKLLANSAKVTRPIDIELQYWWESKLCVFGLQPYTVSPDHKLFSEIDKDQNRKKAKQSFPKKVVSGLYFLFKNKKELKKRLHKLNQR